MSSLPGLTLEDFVAWNCDVVVLHRTDPNPSLQIAEAIGTNPRTRPRLTPEAFTLVLAPYLPYREQVESLLADFDEETQSWRDYSSIFQDVIPEVVHEESAKLANLEWPLLRPTYCERCPRCGNHGPESMEVRNYDPVWRDGDVHCLKCDAKVRSYDAG